MVSFHLRSRLNVVGASIVNDWTLAAFVVPTYRLAAPLTLIDTTGLLGIPPESSRRDRTRAVPLAGSNPPAPADMLLVPVEAAREVRRP
jgi:hypothetical protein